MILSNVLLITTAIAKEDDKINEWNPREEAERRGIQGTYGCQSQRGNFAIFYDQRYFDGLNASPILSREVFDRLNETNQNKYLQGYVTGSDET